jgi:hypothetical protein
VRRTVAFVGVATTLLGCAETASSDQLTPCGGPLVGNWVAVEHHVTTPPNPNVNACWNLMGAFAGGMYSASTRYPVPEQRTSYVTFTPDGSYRRAQVRSGPVTLTYAAECLVTDQGTPTCAELQAALGVYGIGQGSYYDTVCADQASGGCSCSVRVSEVGGTAGTWQAASATAVTLTNPMGDPEPTMVTVPYCVNASGLRFGDGIDSGSPAFWPHTSDVTFGPRDCNGSVQELTAKYGADCAFVCDTALCGGSLK